MRGRRGAEVIGGEERGRGVISVGPVCVKREWKAKGWGRGELGFFRAENEEGWEIRRTGRRW